MLTRTTMTAVNTTYTYDATNQLLGDTNATFTYDATGNRTNSGYSTTTGNQVTNDGLWTYTYDAQGNETGKSNATDTWDYKYDNRNELTVADHHLTGTVTLDLVVTYTYDAFGNRSQQSYDADGAGAGSPVVTKFVQDGWNPALKGGIGNSRWNVLADLDGGGSLKTRYLRGDVVDQLFAELAYNGSSFTPSWTLTDIRGSVRDVINNSAGVVDSINYGAFGNILAGETSSSDRGRYAWTGRELDIETGLQYNRARYYDSHAGRWLSQDPLGFNAGDSNLYRYVNNRPTVATDPSGLDVQVMFPSFGDVYTSLNPDERSNMKAIFKQFYDLDLDNAQTKNMNSVAGIRGGQGYYLYHVRFKSNDNKCKSFVQFGDMKTYVIQDGNKKLVSTKHVVEGFANIDGLSPIDAHRDLLKVNFPPQFKISGVQVAGQFFVFEGKYQNRDVKGEFELWSEGDGSYGFTKAFKDLSFSGKGAYYESNVSFNLNMGTANVKLRIGPVPEKDNSWYGFN